jgi:hypothetical protein
VWLCQFLRALWLQLLLCQTVTWFFLSIIFLAYLVCHYMFFVFSLWVYMWSCDHTTPTCSSVHPSRSYHAICIAWSVFVSMATSNIIIWLFQLMPPSPLYTRPRYARARQCSCYWAIGLKGNTQLAQSFSCAVIVNCCHNKHPVCSIVLQIHINT